MVYDPTAGIVDTPGGPGRFIEFDGKTSTVAVELDNQHLVFFPSESCYVREV